jgi:Domain of unknown function (DUF1844)
MTGGGQQLPAPTFDVLVQVIAAPAMVHLGILANPATGKIEKNLEQARWHIDLLHVLEEKSRASLTSEESARVGQLLAQLRNAYVTQSTR